MSHLFTVSVHWFNSKTSSEDIKQLLVERELDSELSNLSATSEWGPHDTLSFETDSIAQAINDGYLLNRIVTSKTKDGTGSRVEINGELVSEFLKKLESDVKQSVVELRKTRTRFASSAIRDVRCRLQKYIAVK